MHSLFNIFLNLVELALMIATAFVVPLKLPSRRKWYFVYTGVSGITWFVFAVVAMFWWPEPGIGVILLGFLSWLLGTVVFIAAHKARSK
jgi:hypothetical protein